MSEITKASKPRQARKWTETQARAALDDLAKSGLSIEKFAKQKGVSGQRVGYWKKKLRETRVISFVPVHTASRGINPAPP